MSSQTVVDLVVGVAVLGLLVYRQLRPRPVRAGQRLLLILLVVGLIEAVESVQKLHAGSIVVAALAGSLVLAALFGAARALTVRVWIQDGQPWVQGNALTALLWVVALAAHLGYDDLIARSRDVGHLGDATVLLYLAVSLGVQRLVVLLKANRAGLAAS